MSNSWSTVGQLSPTFSQEAQFFELCCGKWRRRGGRDTFKGRGLLKSTQCLAILIYNSPCVFIALHLLHSFSHIFITLFRIGGKFQSWKFETLVDGKWDFLTVRKYCGNLWLVWHAHWLNINMLVLWICFAVYYSCRVKWVQQWLTGSILKCPWHSCLLVSCLSRSIFSLKLWFGATDRTFQLTLPQFYVVCFPIRYASQFMRPNPVRSQFVLIMNTWICHLCFV